MAIDRWAVAFNITMMEKTSKEYYVCFSYLIRLDSGKTLKIYNFNWMTLTLKESTGKLRKLNSPNLSTISSQKKSESERFQSSKIYREDNNIQLTAKAVFDYSMKDNDRFKLLFETGSNLKWMWQFIYLSFMDQDLMMLELRYKQYAEEFNQINTHQYISKGDRSHCLQGQAQSLSFV